MVLGRVGVNVHADFEVGAALEHRLHGLEGLGPRIALVFLLRLLHILLLNILRRVGILDHYFLQFPQLLLPHRHNIVFTGLLLDGFALGSVLQLLFLEPRDVYFALLT